MWETRSYKTHEDHKNLYEALEKSMDRDHSDQLQAYLVEARKKRQKRSDSPRTPSGSPPPPPPPPPPSSGAYGAPGALGASGSSQMPPPPPPPSTDINRGNQQQGSGAPSLYESAGFTATQETSPTDYLINDDSIPDEQWKPLLEEERPATPEPAWTIPSSNVSDVENNRASALVSTYEPPAENSLLAKTGDMTTFMNWYYQKVNKTVITQADFEEQAYEVIKVFYPDVVHLQFQMEECHKMFTDQID
ncbi:hypothetical protein Tco_1463360 [Tanacetum coccineum]